MSTSGNLSTSIACILLAAVCGSALMTSCFKEEFDTSPGAQLAFSTDTLRFDTVFTELGSATRSFRIYNQNDLSVRISRIYLEQSGSRYRVNVDGYAGPDINDVEIRGKDSIWVFAEVTINPDAPVSVSPFITEDYLVFETNGNTQKVLLEAWGQNANYIPSRFSGNTVSVLSCNLENLRWDDPKPYVLYGTLLIDSCTLILPAGTRLYVHGGIADNVLGTYNDGIIYTLPRGRLTSEGTLDDPVIIQDDRLESEYIGLWGGIRFGPGSGPHKMTHTTIRHAATAIAVDSASRLDLNACVIHGTAGAGIFARHATVNAVNCLIYDTGTNGIAQTYGGQSTFDYCTIATFGNDANSVALTNFYCNDPLCSDGEIYVNNLQASFRNSIIVGSSSDEILLSDAAPGQNLFHVNFENCIVQVRDLLDDTAYPDFFQQMCAECLTYAYGDTLFENEQEEDFHLDSLSIAEAQAQMLNGISLDLDGRDRDAATPDIGCYEYYPE